MLPLRFLSARPLSSHREPRRNDRIWQRHLGPHFRQHEDPPNCPPPGLQKREAEVTWAQSSASDRAFKLHRPQQIRSTCAPRAPEEGCAQARHSGTNEKGVERVDGGGRSGDLPRCNSDLRRAESCYLPPRHHHREPPPLSDAWRREQGLESLTPFVRPFHPAFDDSRVLSRGPHEEGVSSYSLNRGPLEKGCEQAKPQQDRLEELVTTAQLRDDVRLMNQDPHEEGGAHTNATTGPTRGKVLQVGDDGCHRGITPYLREMMPVY
eukprot:2898025-Rhodomonas_salina.2